jgi:hypothetical protein
LGIKGLASGKGAMFEECRVTERPITAWNGA